MQSHSVMKLQFRLEVSPQERLRAKERVLGRRVLLLSSSSASLSRRPHVTSATLRDLMGTAAISHGAAPQRTKALCRSGEVPPGTLSLRAFPQRFLAPRLWAILQLPSGGKLLPVGDFTRAWGVITSLLLGSETFQWRGTRHE